MFTKQQIKDQKKDGKRITTKHNASKKGFKHQHNLSKGQLKDAKKAAETKAIYNQAIEDFDNGLYDKTE